MNFVMIKFDIGIVKKTILKIINYLFFIKVFQNSSNGDFEYSFYYFFVDKENNKIMDKR